MPSGVRSHMFVPKLFAWSMDFSNSITFIQLYLRLEMLRKGQLLERTAVLGH